MAGASEERRRDSRADLALPVRVASAGDGDVLSVSTINIGAGGVYLDVPHFIEPLTKLSVSLEIPGPTPGEESTSFETEAIVVRTLPESEEEGRGSYEIACAFLGLKDEHRDVINRYVLTHKVSPGV